MLDLRKIDQYGIQHVQRKCANLLFYLIDIILRVQKNVYQMLNIVSYSQTLNRFSSFRYRNDF